MMWSALTTSVRYSLVFLPQDVATGLWASTTEIREADRSRASATRVWSAVVERGQEPEQMRWLRSNNKTRDPLKSERSLERITKADLRRLRNIALLDLESLFRRKPGLRMYRDRLLAIALCQGAALHYIDKKHGVKDFDVWCFFRAHPKRPFPYRRNQPADFGNAKFGQSPDREHYVGRRVDLLGRSLPVKIGGSPRDVLRAYLTAGKTASARALAAKAMVLVYPVAQLGRVVWPVPVS
jgi:hypothetical protein